MTFVTLGFLLLQLTCIIAVAKYLQKMPTGESTSDGPFSLDFYIFIALSKQRSNQLEYEQVQNMTIDMIEKSCNPQVNGSIFIYMPKSISVAVCSWSNITKCTEELMDTPLETAQMNASDIVEHDIEFAPDVLHFVRSILFEDNPNKHYGMLLVTDFVSIMLEESTYYFTEVGQEHDLTLELIVVLDDWEKMSREIVIEHYGNLTSDDLILTPPDFDDLPNINQIPLSCSSSIITQSSYPWTNNTTASTMIMTTTTQHKKPNPDDNQIMIAILVSCKAGEENFRKIKNFVSANVDNCMKQPDKTRPIEIYVYYPSGFINGITFCPDSSCVNSILDDMDLNNSCVPAIEMSDTETKEVATECAVRIGFTLLLENGPKKSTTGDNAWPPTLLVVSDYESKGFADVYDKDKSFRTNISHLEFRIFVVNATIDYYKHESSIPNNDVFRYENYDAMVGKTTEYCPPITKESDNNGIEIAAVCAASVLLFVVIIGFAAFIYYKRKQRLQRHKQTGAFIGIGKTVSSAIDENGELHHLPSEQRSEPTAEYNMYYVERK